MFNCIYQESVWKEYFTFDKSVEAFQVLSNIIKAATMDLDGIMRVSDLCVMYDIPNEDAQSRFRGWTARELSEWARVGFYDDDDGTHYYLCFPPVSSFI